MPGMMDTVFNLGLNDETVAGPGRGSRRTSASPIDSYRRFIQMYGDVVLGVDHYLFEEALEEAKTEAGVRFDNELDALALKKLVETYKAIVKRETGDAFPDDPEEQLWGAVGAVFGSWHVPRAVTYRRLHDISARHGHGRQRPGHGLRQHGQRLRHRRRLHPQPVDRRAGLSTASSWSTPRARTWSPASARHSP